MGNGNSSSNPKKQRTPIIDVTRVSSGYRSEKCAFTWKIENFNVVRQSQEQICAQKFEFVAGEKIGLPCKMSCWLHYVDPTTTENSTTDTTTTDEPVKKWIGLYYNLVQAPEAAVHVNTQMEIEIVNRVGQKFMTADGKLTVMNVTNDERGIADVITKQGWGFPQVIDQEIGVDRLPLIEGSLIIFLRFTMYAPNPTVTDTGSFRRLRKMDDGPREMYRSVHGLLKDFNKLLEPSSASQEEDNSSTFADIKIITQDEQVFKAHKAILSVRSPVFAAMFRNSMLESQTGVIRINDISAATTQVLLQFIYTGTLSHNWYKSDIVVELTNAAAKYELKDLLEFLDGRLGSICDEHSAGKLLILASRLNLAKAEKQILDYIKQHGISKSKDFLSIVKNIAAANEKQS